MILFVTPIIKSGSGNDSVRKSGVLVCEEGNVLSHELVKLKLSHYPGSEILAFAFEAVNFASPIINPVLEIINFAPDMVICGRNKMNKLSRRSSSPFWK